MIKEKIEQILFNRKWRKLNSHNYTSAKNKFDEKMVFVGKKTYGALIVYTYNNVSKLYIGNYCSIGPNAQFVLSADHRSDTISTYPFKVKVAKQLQEGVSKGNIIIDDDVWIGTNVTILSGVHIGQGAIIAAGAVVTQDILPYAIVGGVPAKVLRYRFEREIIEALLQVDFSLLSDYEIESKIELLYTTLTKENYVGILGKLTYKN